MTDPVDQTEHKKKRTHPWRYWNPKPAAEPFKEKYYKEDFPRGLTKMNRARR